MDMPNSCAYFTTPKTILVGGGAQLGVFVTFTGTVLAGFTLRRLNLIITIPKL
jgi:Na+-transporting methylmalonyl-CoA/oxaloacetate decarboxylase beta subunit